MVPDSSAGFRNKDEGTHQLDVISPQAQLPLGSLPHNCKGLHQEVLLGLTPLQPLPELLGLVLQLLVAQASELRLQGVDSPDARLPVILTAGGNSKTRSCPDLASRFAASLNSNDRQISSLSRLSSD